MNPTAGPLDEAPGPLALDTEPSYGPDRLDPGDGSLDLSWEDDDWGDDEDDEDEDEDDEWDDEDWDG